MFYTAELVVRLSGRGEDGKQHVVEFGMDTEFTWEQLWRAAYGDSRSSTQEELQRLRDGQPAVDRHGNAHLWSQAQRLREASDELTAKCTPGSRSD